MTGGGADTSGRPYTLDEADEACRRGGGRQGAGGPTRIMAEDVILLLLHADTGPMGGGDGAVRRAILAAAAALRGLGVEPALLGGGREARRGARIDDAVEQLVFSKKVRMHGDRKNKDFAIGITERGRAAIRERYESLPAAEREELGRIRAAEAGARPPPPPAASGAAGAGSEELLKRGSRAAVKSGGPGRCRAAKKPPARGAKAAKCQGYVDRGDRLLEEGRHDEAYANYKLAAGLRAPGAGLHLRMARSMAEMGLYRDALKHCRAAIKKNPAAAGAYSAAGHCLSSLVASLLGSVARNEL